MVIVNYGKNRATLLLGGSITDSLSDYIIGTGSSTITSSDTELVTPVDRQSFTSTTYPTTQKVKMQGDWNSVEMSGIQLSEFAVLTSGTALTGSIWSRDVIPSLTFEGSNE